MTNKSDSQKELATALAKAQNVICNVGKNKKGYNYSYADINSIINEIKSPLSANGLSYTQDIGFVILEGKGVKTLTTTMLHESGEWRSSEALLDMTSLAGGKTSQSQDFGAGVAYVRKYALAAMFGLAQDDNDAAITNKSINENRVSEQSGEIINNAQFKDLCKAVSALGSTKEQNQDMFKKMGYPNPKLMPPVVFMDFMETIKNA